MPNSNPFDQPINRVVGRLEQFRKQAERANPIPLGMERVSNSTFRSRFEQMSEEEKRETIERMGLPDLMKALGAD